MLDVCLLGTGGMMPLPSPHRTCLRDLFPLYSRSMAHCGSRGMLSTDSHLSQTSSRAHLSRCILSDKQKKAKEYKHMTFYEAARIAKDADVKEMWLTHYSPSLTKPEEYMDEVRGIFPGAVAAPL